MSSTDALDQTTGAPDEVLADADRPRRSVVRNSAMLAVAALVSRVTGLLAKVFIIGVLSLSVVNDSYTLANTLPNIVFELLIGGVLTSVAIPLLTRARLDPDGGERYTHQLVTLSIVGVAVVTAVAVATAPLLTRLYLSSDFQGDPDLATHLAYLLLPQILFYALAGVFGAILNTKERFAAPAWAPVANNLVVIAVAVTLAFTVGGFNSPVGVDADGFQVYGQPTATQFYILGIGTTLGIVVQAAMLVPSLYRSGFRFRWRFGWDPRMTEAAGLTLWAVLYVVVSQVGYIVFTGIASRQDGGLAQYYFASLLFQTPYGILGVSILTAIMPRMSRHAAVDDIAAVKADMSLANRLSAVALLPVSALIIALAGAVGVISALWGHVNLDDAITVGLTCAGLCIGLLGLAVTLVQMRVFYAYKDARTPTLINAVMVGIRIPLLFLSTRIDPDQLIPGLAVATALSYLIGAVVGEIWLRHRFGPMGTTEVLSTVGRMTLASAVGGAAAFGAVRWIWGGFPDTLVEALLQCLVGAGVGLPVIVGTALLLRVRELQPMLRRLGAIVRRQPRPAGTVSEAVGGAVPDLAGVPEPSTREQVTAPVSGDLPVGTTPDETSPADPVGAAPADAPTDDGDSTVTSPDLRPVTAAGTVDQRHTPGTMVGGRYRLVSLVAVDAAGNHFWRAKDTVLPRDMAVTLLTDGPNTSATVARTLRAGRLHHIGLPQTLDLGTEGDVSYIVSQWVDGATLTDLLAGGPLDGEVASSITAKVADAVAEAHRNGISLGALLPSLVRVNFDGQVRLSHVVCYPGATPDQDIRAVGGLLYLMLTGTYPLPQNGMTPPLPVSPNRGGREVPADEVTTGVPAGLSALAERTLHPAGSTGVRSAAAISTLLADAESERPAVESDVPVPLTPRQLAEKRLLRERRVKLGIAGVMLVSLTVLIAIVIGSVVTRVVDSVQDPVITSDQRLDAPTTTLPPTSGGEVPPVTDGSTPSTQATTSAAVEVPVAITGGEVYDPQGSGSKDYTAYVDRAYDNDPSSAWKTFTYKQQFGPNGLKTGVGLMLTLERDVKPSSVIVATTTPGIKVEVRASDGNVDAGIDATRVLASSDVGNSPAAIAIPPDAPTSSHIIIFITSLVQIDGQWEGAISSVTVNTTG